MLSVQNHHRMMLKAVQLKEKSNTPHSWVKSCTITLPVKLSPVALSSKGCAEKAAL